MPKQTMIAVTYERIPHRTEYHVNIDVVDVIVEEGAEAREDPLKSAKRESATMEELITELHQLLRTYPKAAVTMIRGTTRPIHFGQKAPMGFILDYKMRDLIRDDLDGAKEAFAPIERVVQVRPTPPRVAIKE